MSIVFDDVVNDMETAILLQTAISQKRTRTRITSGMIRKWNMMAKRERPINRLPPSMVYHWLV